MKREIGEFDIKLAYLEDEVRSSNLSIKDAQKISLSFINKLEEGITPEEFTNLMITTVAQNVPTNSASFPNQDNLRNQITKFQLQLLPLKQIGSQLYGKDYMIKVYEQLLKVQSSNSNA